MNDSRECKKVLPGEPVATAEEYIAGQGTYESEGTIYATGIGTLRLDDKNKMARLKFDNPPMSVCIGDKVFCEITNVRSSMVVCAIQAIEGSKRSVTGDTTGTIHVSKISNKYVEDATREYRLTDIIRAEVIQVKPSIQLTTAKPHLGVILARCRNCREPMDRQQDTKLYCEHCERTEYRKVSNDYRAVAM